MDVPSTQLVASIYELIWNAKFNQAEEQLEPLLKKHPAFSLLYTEVAVTKYFLSEQKADYEVASKRIAAVRKDCSALFKIRKPALKQYLAEIPPLTQPVCCIKVDYDNLPEIDCSGELTTASGINLKHVSGALWARAILAELNFMDTGIKVREQKFLKAMPDLKKSWDLYKECNEVFHQMFQTDRPLKEVPQLVNIRCLVDFGVGLFHFICSVIPRHFQFFVEVVGFQADRLLAMAELKRSMRCELAIRSHVASLALCWIYAFFYHNHDVANQILNLEIERFPTSPVILFTNGYVQRKQGNITESNAALVKAQGSVPSIPTFQLKIDYERGANHFLLLEWKPALELLTHFLENNQAPAFRTYGAYQIAFCHIMLGNQEEAARYMKMIAPWIRKNFALDEYAGHQAKKYFKKLFNAFEITYQQAMLAQEACNYQRVLDLLDSAKEQEEGLRDTARSLQLRGSALAHMKLFDQAKAAYQEVLAQEKPVQKTGTGYMYALPFSYCGMVEIAIVEKDAAAGATYLKKAKSFSNYEFETLLQWRIRKCEDDLRELNRS